MKKQKNCKTKNTVLAAMLTAVLLPVLLLTSCAKTPEENENGQPSDPAQSTELSAPVQNKETAQSLPPWVLYETEDYTILMTDAMDPYDRMGRFYITIVNNSENSLSLKTSEIIVNGSVHSSETVAFSCEPNKVKVWNCYFFDQWYAQYKEDVGDIHKLSFTLYLLAKDPATYEEKDNIEQECTIVLPDDYKTKMVYQPVLSMKAEEQILFESEDVLIELCGLGKNPDDLDLYALTGVVRVVNRTEHSIPVDFAGIRVNGYYVDPYSFGGGRLAAGAERYLLILCKSEDLEKAAIDQISTIELLILSSDSENTGAYTDAGGSWYPVSLSQAGEASADSGQDQLLYEDDYITIALRRSYLEWHDITYATPYGYYHWLMAVTNKTDENITLSLEELAVDGISNQELDTGSRVWPRKHDIGANSRSVIELTQQTHENNPIPVLSFRVQVRTLGDGKLLHEAAEPTVVEVTE